MIRLTRREVIWQALVAAEQARPDLIAIDRSFLTYPGAKEGY